MNENKMKLFSLLGCTLISGTAIALFGNCIGAFITPVSEALSFSRSAFALTATISTVISALSLPLYTKLLKKFSVKLLILICALGCSSAAVFYSFSKELWQFYLAAALNGIFINGVTMMTASAILSKWYQEKLSFAVGVAFAGMGIISAATLPLIRWVISSMGFKAGYLLIAIIGSAVILPSALFLIKTPQEKKEVAVDNTTFVQILKERRYQICAVALFLGNLSNLAIYNNSISYLTDMGYESGFVSIVLAVALVSMTVAKPLVGAALDKLPIQKGSIIPIVAIISSAVLALFSTGSMVVAIIFGVSLSFCATINSIVSSSAAQQLFKKEAYMKSLSLLTMASYLGSAAGTPIGALVHDVTGEYTFAWIGCIGLSVVALVLFLSLEKFNPKKS